MTPPEDVHPALREILAAATEKGWHICSWSSLRTAVFPGTGGWAALKAWCEERDLDCALCFSQSSKKTEVQFRRRHRVPKAAAPVES